MATPEQIADRLRLVMQSPPSSGFTPQDPFASQRHADQAMGVAWLTPSKYVMPPPSQPVQGMEKLGPLPGPVAPPNVILNPPSDAPDFVKMAYEAKYGTPPETLGSAFREPVQQVAGGAGRILDAKSGRDVAGGARQILGGATQVLMAPEVMGPAIAAAPLGTAVSLGSGMAAQRGTEAGLKALGVPDEYAGLAGDTAGLLAAGGSAAVLAMAPRVSPGGPAVTAPPPRRLSSEAGVGNMISPAELLHAGQRFTDKWIDAGMPIKRLENAGDVAGDASAYQAYRNFSGNPGRLQLRMKERDAILGPADQLGLRPDVDRYLELQRHEENFQNPNKGIDYKTPGNMTLGQVQSELSDMQSRLGPGKMAVVDQAAQGLRDWSDKTLGEYQQSGMISTDQKGAMTQPGHKYAPLQRQDFVPEDMEHVPLGGRSFNQRSQPVVKELKGSERDIVSPIEGFTRNVLNMTRIADRNLVTSRIGDMAQSPDFQGAIRPLGPEDKPGAGEGAISTFRNGVKESYAVPKPVADAVAGMNTSDADLMMRWARNVRALNRVMIEGSTTFNPAFQVGNILRDYKTATLQAADAGHLFTPATWAKGFWSAVKQDQFFDKYLDSGGAMSGLFERMSGNPTTASKVWDAIHWPSTKIEQAPRVGFFRMMDEANLRGAADRSLREMGFLSRNATTDFARSGSDMRQLNMWIPMLNARKEGLVNSLSAFKSSPAKSLLVLNAFALPSVLSYFHNVAHYPDAWKDISQQYKNNYDFLITGPDKDEQNNYPNVWGMRKDDLWAAYSNLLIDSLERFRGENPQPFSRVATQVLSDTLPVRFADEGQLSGYQFLSSVLPAPVKAFAIEPLANRNLSTGTPIETDAMKAARPWARYTNDTPPWLVRASKLMPESLGLSPRQMQNMISTQGGAAGRMIAGDVKQGRDALMERTGMGPVARMFRGAPGGGLERQDFENAKPIAMDAADTQLDRSREADRLWRETKDLPPQQRVGVLADSYRQGKLDLPTFEKYLGTAKDGLEKISNFERWLRAEPMEARAPIIVQKLDLAPDRSAARDLFQRYAQIGALTDEAAQAMGKIYTTRGYGLKQSTAPAPASPEQAIQDALRRAMQGGK